MFLLKNHKFWVVTFAANERLLFNCSSINGSPTVQAGVVLATRISRYTSFIQVVCLTTGPKPLPKRDLHIVRARASSFKWEFPLLSLRSSSCFLRLLPRLPVTSIIAFTFPSITRCRGQFLRKMWPIQFAFRLRQFAFRLRISCRIFFCSLTLSNTSSFLTWSVQLIFSILLQHHYGGIYLEHRPGYRLCRLRFSVAFLNLSTWIPGRYPDLGYARPFKTPHFAYLPYLVTPSDVMLDNFCRWNSAVTQPRYHPSSHPIYANHKFSVPEHRK